MYQSAFFGDFLLTNFGSCVIILPYFIGAKAPVFTTKEEAVMKKNELIGLVSEKCGISKKDCMLVLDSVIETITETLANGEDVMLFGFGKFEIREYKERNCFNPSSNKVETVKGSKQPCFKPGMVLREKVSGK